MTSPNPHVIVLFGATGDLASRKLLPGMMHLASAGLMPEFEIVGASRSSLNDEQFRDLARRSCREFSREGVGATEFEAFAARLSYVELGAGPAGLAAAVARAEGRLGGEPERLLYLSVPPSAAGHIIEMVHEAGLADGARLVAEKPFGTDYASAQALNATIHSAFDEEQVFRIDHFLGKEAAQNILALRFANGLFEPIWNRSHISHVQIDVPETLGAEGRGGFYEGTGAYRDMVVTHLLQVLAFVAMEPPTDLSPAAISIEKNKVFRSLLPIDPANVVRGQYDGYRGHDGVADDSETETLVALRCDVDNWRWSGVPFYLRTGKRMAEGARIISIAFREPPKSMFPVGSGVGEYGPDHLTFDLDDSSRLSLSYYGKRPGPGMSLEKLSMQFSLAEAGRGSSVLEAYERLIWDAINGDATLFTTAVGIERLWEVSAPLIESPPGLHPYAQGSWGPEAVHDVIAPGRWRLPFERRWREAAPPAQEGHPR
ncbi:MAG: glucose-6-phosphate dehydrogenase [Solirubrobacterales bacterium]|nr:glucose-6-phosphate dehydrogenase [Solirubrobacterales bacterium]